MESQRQTTLKPSTSPTTTMSNGRLQFFNLVKAMREAQREYFSTRSHGALQKARQLERSVDAYIKRGDDYLNNTKQPSLFDNEK